MYLGPPSTSPHFHLCPDYRVSFWRGKHLVASHRTYGWYARHLPRGKDRGRHGLFAGGPAPAASVDGMRLAGRSRRIPILVDPGPGSLVPDERQIPFGLMPVGIGGPVAYHPIVESGVSI